MAEEADIGYLMEEAPVAIGQALEGVNQVAHIVRAIKAFGHSGGEEKPADLNESINNTLVVAQNETKFIAEVTTEGRVAGGAMPRR